MPKSSRHHTIPSTRPRIMGGSNVGEVTRCARIPRTNPNPQPSIPLLQTCLMYRTVGPSVISRGQYEPILPGSQTNLVAITLWLLRDATERDIASELARIRTTLKPQLPQRERERERVAYIYNKIHDCHQVRLFHRFRVVSRRVRLADKDGLSRLSRLPHHNSHKKEIRSFFPRKKQMDADV